MCAWMSMKPGATMRSLASMTLEEILTNRNRLSEDILTEVKEVAAGYGVAIRRADVKADYGWVVLELDGEEAQLERGVKWLKEKGVQVDPIEHDVISP